MRPLRLTLTAFGPFAGREEIDFEKLGDWPLFLINGPTGSGKTTILDGICYALYGKTTGGDREPSQMRCDGAAIDVLTRVELQFSLGDRQWRVCREPEQPRPKGRGEGMTRHPPRAELYRCEENGEESVIVASKVVDVRTEIEAMVGLNVDQFRQVMILPQGGFRKLLVASSGEREKVFAHLFQTQNYGRIEQLLKERASVLRSELEAYRNQQQGILQSADAEDEPALDDALARQLGLLGSAKQARKQQEKLRDQAEKELLNARKLNQGFIQLAQARERLQSLQQRSDENESYKGRIQQARVALRMMPAYTTWQDAETILANARQRIEMAQRDLDTRQLALSDAESALVDVRAQAAEIEATGRLKIELEDYRGRVEHLQSAENELSEAELEHRQLVDEVEHLSSLVEERVKEIERQKQQYQQLSERLRGLGDMRLELRRREDLYQVGKSLAELGTQMKSCLQQLQQYQAQGLELAQKHRLAELEYEQLELAWHAGQAVVLARKLKQDIPCPVCGSRQHPDPAISDQPIPDEVIRQGAKHRLGEVQKAQKRLAAAIASNDSRIEQLNLSLSLQRTRLDGADEQLVSVLREERNHQQQRVTSLEAEQVLESEYAQQLEKLVEGLQAQQKSLRAAEQRQASFQTRVEVRRAEKLVAEKEVPAAYRDRNKLEQEIAILDEKISRFDRQKEQLEMSLDLARQACSAAQANRGSADEQRNEMQQRLHKVKGKWLAEFAASRFDDLQTFVSFCLEEPQLKELEERVEQYSALLSRSEGVVKSLEEQLKGEHEPRLEDVESKATCAKVACDLALEEQAAADKQYGRLQETLEKYRKLKKQMDSLEASYAVVGNLADTANGKIGRRVSLQRFVLSVLLDDVLIEASQRFKKMSKGRYVMYRQADRAKGGRASGLELLVDDAYTGKQRSVVTLSGGESFMAALSLALGLSEVVQAYAGGIRIETLFIDEGFGSLDPEALDLAIDTLIELQSTGRMVGLISHVPELKERINVRLDILMARSGSHTQLVTA